MFRHLKQVNMTYYQHMKHSLGLSYDLLNGSIKAFVHGIFPNLYETSTTDLTIKLNNKLNIKS